MTLKERMINKMIDKREKVLSGKINSIPHLFPRFGKAFFGIERGKYYLVSANQKVGKSQFTNYFFVFNPILYAFKNRDKIRLKIMYFNMEETEEVLYLRFISYLLYIVSGGKILLSTTDLTSAANVALPQHILDLLETSPYKEVLDFYEQCVEFRGERHPTGIKIAIDSYIRSHGTIIRKPIEYEDKLTGEVKTMNIFDKYIPNDPDEYFLPIFDHIGLTQPEKGQTLKQAIDDVSTYNVKIRNRYEASPVVVQQQAGDQESVENFKYSKLRPTPGGLSDSRYPSRDASIMFGLFSPARHDIPEYLKYNIKEFQDHIRFLEVCINRDGEANYICPLFFHGAVNYFAELPLPSDTEGLKSFYNIINPQSKSINLIHFNTTKTLWEKLSAFLANLGKVKQPQ